MRDQTSYPDYAQISQTLTDTLAGNWQGRAVLAQLRSDPAAGSQSLRALLTEAPPPPLAALVAWYGVDELVRAADTARHRQRSRHLMIAGGVLAVIAAATVAVLLFTGGSGTGSTAIPLTAPSSSTQSRPSAAPGVHRTPATQAGAGPVVGDINDQEVQATVERRLSGARWVPFARDGFSYRARAVMVHTPTDGTDSAPPTFHKLIFIVQVLNLQADRPAPLPVGKNSLSGDLIDVPKRLTGSTDGSCDYPFSSIWAASDDRCTVSVVQYGAQRYEDTQIPANDSLDVAVEAESDIPDSIPDSEVKLYLRDEKGPRFEDVSSVDVPLT